MKTELRAERRVASAFPVDFNWPREVDAIADSQEKKALRGVRRFSQRQLIKGLGFGLRPW